MDFLLVLKPEEADADVAPLVEEAPPLSELDALTIAFTHAGAPDDLAAAPAVLDALDPAPLALIVEAMAWVLEAHREVEAEAQRGAFALKRAKSESARLLTERNEWKERFIAQDRKQAAVEGQLKKATAEFKAEKAALAQRLDRATKSGVKLQHLVVQHRATIRRKETEFARLQDRLTGLFKKKHSGAARGLEVNEKRRAVVTTAEEAPPTACVGAGASSATAASRAAASGASATRKRRASKASASAPKAKAKAAARRPALKRGGGAKAARAAKEAEEAAAAAANAPVLESTDESVAQAEESLLATVLDAAEARRVATMHENGELRRALSTLGAPAETEELVQWATMHAAEWKLARGAAAALAAAEAAASEREARPPTPPPAAAAPAADNEAVARALTVQQLERRLAAAEEAQDAAAKEAQRVAARMAKLKRARAASAQRAAATAACAKDATLRRDNDKLRELVAEQKSLLHASLAGGLPPVGAPATAPPSASVASSSASSAAPAVAATPTGSFGGGGGGGGFGLGACDSPVASARDELAAERRQVRAMRAELELERGVVAEQSAELDAAQMALDNDRFILKQTMLRLQQTSGDGLLSIDSLVPLTPAGGARRAGAASGGGAGENDAAEGEEGDERCFDMPAVATPPGSAAARGGDMRLRVAGAFPVHRSSCASLQSPLPHSPHSPRALPSHLRRRHATAHAYVQRHQRQRRSSASSVSAPKRRGH